MIKPFFSIVIPTLNEEKFLPALLEDLNNQTFAKELFEVIHVDGKSEDKTTEVAQSFSDKINLVTLTAEKRNVAFQRNLGGENANGKWIIFMDADDRLPAYFLDGIKYQLAKNPETDVFTTWSEPKNIASLEGSITRILNLGIELYNTSGKPSAFGAMIGVKKVHFNHAQFDETQKFMEDTFFVQSVCENGGNFRIFKEPRYIFSLRRFEKEGTLKFVSNGALLQLKYLQGHDFKDEEKYKMVGGSYYDQISPSLFRNVISQVRQNANAATRANKKNFKSDQ
jgi:glycosyltransferase involved in cell wall biosynthesis